MKIALNKYMTTLFSKRISFLILGLTLLFGSCSTDEDYNIDSSDSQEVKFEIGFAQSENQLRTTTDGNYNTTFSTGDTIGIFAVKHKDGVTGTLLNSANYIHNAKLTLQENGTWVADRAIYYSQDGDVLDFYAYYPYDANATNPTSLNFVVQTNQSSDANFAKSDFLTASNTSVIKGSAVNLSFSHAMSLVVVEVINGAGDAKLTSTGVVKLENVIGAKNENNLQTFAHTMGAGNQTITMNRVNSSDANKSTYRALVPAQMINNNTSTFSFTQDYTSKHILSSVNLNAGAIKKYSITLKTPIQKHVYAIGDVYPYMGTPEGIVCKISNGGKSGTMIGLDEGRNIAWSNVNTPTNMNNRDDGFINMQVALNSSLNFNQFPAMKWCREKGDDWYLPAINELGGIAANLTIINNGLVSVRGTAIDIFSTIIYWTSTEFDENLTSALVFYFDDFLYLQDNKYTNYNVRAMRKF